MLRTFFLFLCLLLLTGPGFSRPIPRKVLALWHSRDGKFGRDYSSSLIHRKIEFVFNHFGLNLDYHDLHEGIPKTDLSSEYVGIVSWLNSEELADASDYANWLQQQLKKKKKLLILGDFGFARRPGETEEAIPRINGVLTLLGIDATGNFHDNPLLSKIEKMNDPGLAEFERKLEREIPPFRVVRNKDPKNSVWLQIRSGSESSLSDVVIVGKNGGLVLPGFTIFSHPQEGKTFWRVNPFVLVETIFAPKALPIPDTTTQNGGRLFFSHIDGDGLMNLSLVDRKRYSSEVIRDEIIRRYPLPVTVSVITMETNPHWEIEGAAKFRDIARGIFKLPNVEPASHTFSHPLSWQKNPSSHERRAYLGEKSTHQGPILSYYNAGKKLDYERETVSSLDYVNENLIPKDKKRAELLLWSGSCLPSGEAIEGLLRRGFVNMNGGDSRMDSTFKSVSHLSALYRRPGGYLQAYSAAPNENIYTNLWSPPFSGFEQVIETFENTDRLRRLKPVNIYYHFYSGEHQASLQSLRQVYDWAMTKELHPIRASLYPKIVQGFLETTIEEVGKRHYLIRNNGALKTVRFESPTLFPDYIKSINILGHRRIHGRLYVFLGPGSEAELILTENKPDAIYLESSNAEVVAMTSADKKLTYKFRGETPVEATFVISGKRQRFVARGLEGSVTLEQK